MVQTMKYEDITRKIIGCAMTVNSTLDNGFQEVIYQRALAIEMNVKDQNFEREKEMPIFYRKQDIGSRRVDFFCRRENYGRIEGNRSTGKCTFS